MDKELIFDDILKEKARCEKLILPEDIDLKLKETITSLPERKKKKIDILQMLHSICNIGVIIKKSGFVEVTAFILILIIIPLVSHHYLNKANGEYVKPPIRNNLKLLSEPDRIIIYNKGSKFELEGNDVNSLKIVELMNERIDNKISTVKDIIDDTVMKTIEEDGIGVEFIYENEKELNIKGDGFIPFKYNKLYFQVTSEKYGNGQGSIVHCMQYGDKEHYKDSSRGPLKYSSDLVNLVKIVIAEQKDTKEAEYVPDFKNTMIKTNNSDMKEIAKQIFEAWLKCCTDVKVAEFVRISEYKINKIEIGNGSLDNGDLNNYVFYVNYSIKPATDKYCLAGNGVKDGSGWILDSVYFVNVKKETDYYTIKEMGTSPIDITGITYINEKYGFSLTLPSSWQDNYYAEEVDNTIMVHHKATWLKDGGGTLFTIYPFTSKDKWNSIGKLLEEMIGLEKIYENDEEVFGFSRPTDVQYDLNDEKLHSEYDSLGKDIDEIVKSFKKIDK